MRFDTRSTLATAECQQESSRNSCTREAHHLASISSPAKLPVNGRAGISGVSTSGASGRALVAGEEKEKSFVPFSSASSLAFFRASMRAGWIASHIRPRCRYEGWSASRGRRNGEETHLLAAKAERRVSVRHVLAFELVCAAVVAAGRTNNESSEPSWSGLSSEEETVRTPWGSSSASSAHPVRLFLLPHRSLSRTRSSRRYWAMPTRSKVRVRGRRSGR